MRSHLTRSVFRAILNNEPVVFPHRSAALLSSSLASGTRQLILQHYGNAQQSRRIFGFAGAPFGKQEPTLPPEIGLKSMRDLTRALADRARPPTDEALANAFRDFFKSREERIDVITEFHARLLVETFEYLESRQDQLEERDLASVFSIRNLENFLYVLSEATIVPDSRKEVRRLAHLVFQKLCIEGEDGENEIAPQAILAYIRILSANGDPEEARSLTRKYRNQLEDVKPSPWLLVLQGYAMNGDRWRLRNFLEEIEKRGVKFDPMSQQDLITIMLRGNLVAAAQTLYECPLSDNEKPTILTTYAIVKAAILKSDISWAGEVIGTIPEPPTAETRDIFLLWHAAQGSGVDVLNQKLQSWKEKNPQISDSLTISTINDLIEYSISIKNPVLATSFSALASQWSLQPDSRTALLSLDAHMQNGDLDMVLKCVQSIPPQDLTVEGNLPLLNRLITMLCYSEDSDAVYDQISAFLDPVIHENDRLEADTVAALTHLLLRRHDWNAVSEILRPRLGTYDLKERSSIRKPLLSFITDLQEDAEHAWQMYNLLTVAFPETGTSARTDIMVSFFKRKRSDLAVLVFGHMRQAENFTQRPKPDTYCRCLQWISRTGDRENLELVHNMLKLDLEVEISTRVYDALMLAYTACEMPDHSLQIFRDILRSEEGPSDKTILIFFKLCEQLPDGVLEADKMMNKVKLLEIELNRQLYTAYISALAAQGEFERAVEAYEAMPKEANCTPNRHTYVHLLFLLSFPPPFSIPTTHIPSILYIKRARQPKHIQ